MTEDEVKSFAERMQDAKAAKAAEREAAGDDLEPDADPKPKRRRRKAATRKPRQPSNRPPSLRAPIKAMLETVGGVWHMSEATRGHEPLSEDYPTCGSVLLAQADDIATNLNALAQTDPNVYRWLDRMMTGGGWGGVVLATWPVAQAVLQSHVMPAVVRRRELVEVEEGQEGPWSPEPPTV